METNIFASKLIREMKVAKFECYSSFVLQRRFFSDKVEEAIGQFKAILEVANVAWRKVHIYGEDEKNLKRSSEEGYRIH